MYFWNSYPFVRLSIFLISGILAYDSLAHFWKESVLLLIALFTFFILSLFLSLKIGHYKLRHVNGAISLAVFFLIGGELVKRKYDNLSEIHYSKMEGRIKGFSGIIASSVNERTNHNRYDFEIIDTQINDSIVKAEGIIHLYVRKDSSDNLELEYGDILFVKGSFYEVPGPDNPLEFDYRKYLSRQGIYSHSFVRSSDIKFITSEPTNLIFEYAYKIQSQASRIIDKNITELRENGIAKALLLGIKDHLDNEVKKSYAAAGAMHVLAVSGLHVGIVYLFLQYLLGGLRSTAFGSKVFGVISIIIIWLYAIITGLSPSVLRAATMFSIIALSDIRSQKGNIYNALGFAAFVLLLFDPYLIYSVGFQLSFAAVFGIVYLQPKIYRLFNFNTWIVDKAWAITCVSIAAQLATFPLSAFYFHQFPTYFLISNLVVIPAATVMLVGGIVMLIIDPIIGVLGNLIGELLSKFIWVINESVSLVESLPYSLLDWIYVDQISMILIYATVLSLIWGLHHRSFMTLIICFILIISFSGWQVKSNFIQASARRIIAYEIKGKTAIDYIDGHDATLFVDAIKKEDLELLSYQINPNRLALHLKPISESIQIINGSEQFQIQDSFVSGALGGKRILIIDSTTFHFTYDHVIETDLLIIENEAVKNLSWLNENFRYDHLIIGNRNSNFFARKMKKQGVELGLKVHSISRDGAFILEI